MREEQEAAATGAVAPANESNNFPPPPYFYAIFTPLSVRVSEDLATAYKPLFGSLYTHIALPM